MKKVNLLVSFVMVFITITTAIAQEKNITDVISIELKNMGPILDDSQITGYYLFYQTDKLSRKVYSYEIQILDQNLNELSVKTIEGSKNLFLLDMVYNNKEIMLKFYDSKKREIILQKFDNNLEEVMKEERDIDRTEAAILAQFIENKEAKNNFLQPVPNYGFLDYRIELNKMKLGYVVDFYPSIPEVEKWTHAKDKKSKGNSISTLLYADKEVAINILQTSKNLMSKSFDVSIQVLDIKTGKERYQKNVNKVNSENYDIVMLSGFKDREDDGIILFGNYYPKGKAKLNKPSLGLFAIKLDSKGNEINKYFLSWETDMAKFLNVNSNGKIKDVGYLSFHNIVKNSDGNIYIVCEQYSKKSNVLSTDLVISDLMILELNDVFQLKNVRVIEKEETNFTLPNGTGLNSPQVLSYIAKSLGGFDYEFSQANKDNSIFTIGYIDEVKESNQYKFGAITYTDSEPVEDSLELTSIKNKDNLKVMPAKAGNVVIVQYDPDKKSLGMKIEKLNY